MNIIYKTLSSATLAAAVLVGAMLSTSCSEDRNVLSGEGTLLLSTSVNSDVKVKAKARATTEEELSEKAIIWISNSNGVVRKYNGLNSIPVDGIKLLSNHYIAEIWTGDSVSADFEKKYFKGREEFDISNNNTTRLQVVCKVANTVSAVEYSESVDEMLANYTMTVGHERGDLVFEGRDERMGYFMMPSYDKDLHWNLEGTLANGTVYTRSGVIENAKPATLYTIKVGYNPEGGDPTNGGAYFTIDIDETTIDVAEEVVISLAPQYEGYDFDLSEVLVGEKGKIGRRSVVARAVGEFKNFVLDSEVLSPIIGGKDVDLLTMSDNVRAQLNNAGINYTITKDEETESSLLKLNFEEELLDALDEGEYTFALTATDSQNKSTTGYFYLTVSNAPVMVEEVNAAEVWGGHATVTARILKEDAENPGISYRRKGDTTWTAATVTVQNGMVSAQLTNLTPGTTYQYTATATDFISAAIREFTTEEATQFPNSGFERWQTSTPMLVYASGDEMFWDTGNHGSATMSKNVTEPATDIKHSGNYSAKLASQFVGLGIIGKFAAGNIFIGKYLETNGTNGVLGWGRPWTSRPTALKGWLHYTPGTVGYTSNDVPNFSKGDTDQGIIYIAILDDSVLKSNSNGNFPIIVKTETKEFFSRDDSNVVAYGELVLKEATTGSDMVEFEIPITYVRNNVKAAYVMMVAAASRYGDYFAGADGSTLYIDDLSLVYE